MLWRLRCKEMRMRMTRRKRKFGEESLSLELGNVVGSHGFGKERPARKESGRPRIDTTESSGRRIPSPTLQFTEEMNVI
jgi:hypothetical protein